MGMSSARVGLASERAGEFSHLENERSADECRRPHRHQSRRSEPSGHSTARCSRIVGATTRSRATRSGLRDRDGLGIATAA